MARERRSQPAGGLDEVRRRRRARRLQEKRRRAALRRRNALACAAIASAVIGAAFGAGAGGGGSGPAPKAAAARPSRGGIGPPRSDQELVAWKGPVPILMYHVIADPPATAQFPELFVDPDTFRAQM